MRYVTGIAELPTVTRVEEQNEGFEAATSGIAFMLLGTAFHELALAVLHADPDKGRALLLDLQRGVAATLRQFETDRPELAGSPVIHEAAGRVRAVMRAAQGLGDEKRDR